MNIKIKSNGEPVSILLSGIRGYGNHYFEALNDEVPIEKYRLLGIIDILKMPPHGYIMRSNRKMYYFQEVEDFYKAGHRADLAIICSPLQFHAPQSITAMKNGSNVLCEKPLAVTIQDAREMVETSKRTGKWLMVGFQWSYSSAIQALKQDILSGMYGKPLKLKTICLWNRGFEYYNRNDWAGKIKDRNGNWILDSPASNAMAHFLHNLLYLIGEDVDKSAQPKEVLAECYRANRIENYDTVAARIFTDDDVELLFYASHAAEDNVNPAFELEFENGKISYGIINSEITAKDKNGNVKNYGSPDADSPFLKLLEAIEFVHNQGEIVCGAEAALPHVLCVNGIQESAEIVDFPREMIYRDKMSDSIRVRNLTDYLLKCYNEGLLPSELKAAGLSDEFHWAESGRNIDLRGYEGFPGGENFLKL